MAAGSPDRFPKHLQTLFTSGAIGGLDDGALLERFVAGRDEAAFEVLVARHGPMVLRVCRAALADPHDADDAFQAVFLVLVRRAVAIRSHASVASWLFGVASRVSARAKVDATRRRRHEQQAALGRPATAPARERRTARRGPRGPRGACPAPRPLPPGTRPLLPRGTFL